jgi:NAD-dependent SIR2 family protein deacetylase
MRNGKVQTSSLQRRLQSSRRIGTPAFAPDRLPPMPVANSKSHAALSAFVRAHPRLFVLTGAGISASSGIPTYRDAAGNWQRAQPITHQQFVGSAAMRRRYWARSMLGWPAVARARPNPAHRALAGMQRAGRVARLVTQNVDGLHQAAGSSGLIELHGSLHSVVCLECGGAESRAAIQVLLEQSNPDLVAQGPELAPDGDAQLEHGHDGFIVPPCPGCGGTLMPDVVFFGGNIPRDRIRDAMAALEDADAVLVVGSSLMVYSGYRLCEYANELGKPVVAINRGLTRADNFLRMKIDADCAEALAVLDDGGTGL